MAMNPATAGDVADRWRTLTAAETALATVLLDDAWLDLTTLVPSLEDRLDDESLSVQRVVRVLAAMVVRVMRNPEGVREYSIDDYRAVRDQALSAGLLYATADELRLLSASASRRSGSIRLVAYGDA